MTLDYTIVRICPREFQAGLFYTGCSRVKEMEKLAIVGYTTRIRENGQETEFPSKQRWGLPGRNILIYFFFFSSDSWIWNRKAYQRIQRVKQREKKVLLSKETVNLRKKGYCLMISFKDLTRTQTQWWKLIQSDYLSFIILLFLICQLIFVVTNQLLLLLLCTKIGVQWGGGGWIILGIYCYHLRTNLYFIVFIYYYYPIYHILIE